MTGYVIFAIFMRIIYSNSSETLGLPQHLNAKPRYLHRDLANGLHREQAPRSLSDTRASHTSLDMAFHHLALIAVESQASSTLIVLFSASDVI